MNHPKISIIVLNWNGLEDTVECLESLKTTTYPNYNVIVVDNGSKGDDVRVLQEKFGYYIQLIPEDKNHGFAEGNNIGIRHALAHDHPDYVLLLNNDATVAPDSLSELVGVAEEDPSVGIAGPKIYSYSEPQTLQSAGGRINWWLGKPSLMGCGETDRGQFDEIKEVDWIIGCALLIRASVLRDIGVLCRSYFAYFEETEWCVRCRKAGYKVMYVPKAKLWHKQAATAGRISGFKLYYMTRNRLLFMRRNSKRRQLLSFCVYFLVWKFMSTAVRLAVQERSWSLLKAFFEGTYDGLGLPSARVGEGRVH